MFTKGKIPQSLIDAVKNVTEAEQIQEYESKDGKFVHKARPGAYGGSKPEKHELDTLRGPKKKDIEDIESEKKKPTNEESALEEAVSRKDFQMVADLIKTHDSHDKRKELAQHHAEIFHRQNPRFDRARFMKAANVNEETIDEVAPPGFEGTVKAMKKHKNITNPFALAWSMKNKGYKSHIKSEEKDYGTHGDDKEEEGEDEKLIKKMVKKSALKTEDVDAATTTDTLAGRVAGGKSNSFKSFKIKIKASDKVETPEEEKPEQTSARATIHADVHKEETKIDESTPPKNTDVADKSYLKDMGKKKGPLHNVGKGLKAFLKGKPEPMESIEQTEEPIVERDEGKPGLNFKKIAKKAAIRYGSKEAGNRVAGSIRKKVLAKEAKRPEDDSVPFDPPYNTNKPDVVTDKSGAKHTPMSRAKDLARTAMKKIKSEMLGKAPGNN